MPLPAIARPDTPRLRHTSALRNGCPVRLAHAPTRVFVPPSIPSKVFVLASMSLTSPTARQTDQTPSCLSGACARVGIATVSHLQFELAQLHRPSLHETIFNNARLLALAIKCLGLPCLLIKRQTNDRAQSTLRPQPAPQ